MNNIVVNQKNKVFTIEQNLDNVYTATIKVFKHENINDNQNQILNKDVELTKEDSLDNQEGSSSENKILVQSQIDLNPEDIMVLKIFAQVTFKIRNVI